MHFERSLYRLYENTLWRAAADEAPGAPRSRCGPLACCRGTIAGLVATCVALLGLLIAAHSAHVGSGGCLLEALHAAADGGNASVVEAKFPPDAVVRWRYTGVAGGGSGVGGDGLFGSAVPLGAASPIDPSGDVAPDYVWSGVTEAVTLGQSARTAHNFTVYNLTLPLCCGATGAGGAVVASGLLSADTVAVNSAMYAFDNRGGYLLGAATDEAWQWLAVRTTEGDVKGLRGGVSRGNALLARLAALAASLLSFWAMSTFSALLLRALFVSGPALLWPVLAAVARICGGGGGGGGARAPLDTRELNAAFPWLGAHVRYIAAAGGDPGPMLRAHGTWLLVVYLAYTAVAAEWSAAPLLAYKSHPAGLMQLLWVVFLASEYFSLIMLRSRWGIAVYPRAFGCLFLAWCAYYHAYPYGFSALAALILALATGALMLAVAVWAEVPALRAGSVSADKPRAYLVMLPAPAAPAAAPDAWTMFIGHNAEATGTWDVVVPPAALALAPGAARPLAEAAGAGAGAAGVGGVGDGRSDGGSIGGAAGAPSVIVAQAPTADDSTIGRRPLLDEAALRESGNVEFARREGGV